MGDLMIRASFLLSRLAVYHPERFSSFVWVDIGYQRPAPDFSVDAINQETEKVLGYSIFGYWYFFNDKEAGGIMNLEVSSLLF